MMLDPAPNRSRWPWGPMRVLLATQAMICWALAALRDRSTAPTDAGVVL